MRLRGYIWPMHGDLSYEYGKKVEEPKQTSGKQEKYETIVALYAK